jgi:hypothetical protein
MSNVFYIQDDCFEDNRESEEMTLKEFFENQNKEHEFCSTCGEFHNFGKCDFERTLN